MEGGKFGLQMLGAIRSLARTLEAGPGVASALPVGIFTSSLPGVFSTTRFTATPSVACRIFPLPAMSGETRKGVKVRKCETESEAQPLPRGYKFLLPARVPLGRPRPRPDGFTTLGFLGGRFSRRDGLPRPVTVKSKSFGSVVVSPTFWK